MKQSDKNQPLTYISHDTMIDRYIGIAGTTERDDFEAKLKIDQLAETIKKLRKEKNLTQSQLGDLIGVKKAQISRIENSTLNIGLYTLHKVFHALDAKITFNIEHDITVDI